MKKSVIDAAISQSKIGFTRFSIDPELVRNGRTEPKGTYPSEGTVSVYLNANQREITAAIHYDGKLHLETVSTDMSMLRIFAPFKRGLK